jgi:hypothetical protein
MSLKEIIKTKLEGERQFLLHGKAIFNGIVCALKDLSKDRGTVEYDDLNITYKLPVFHHDNIPTYEVALVVKRRGVEVLIVTPAKEYIESNAVRSVTNIDEALRVIADIITAKLVSQRVFTL